MTTHLGIDVGGTRTDVVLVDEAGRVLRHDVCPTRPGADGVVTTIRAAVAALSHDAEADLVATTATIGIGVPGTVVDGVVAGAQNLGIERVDLARALEGAWGRRPVVDNDVTAAALGAWLASGGVHRSLALLNLGTGLAAGFVLDGRVWRGARGGAGEIGHVSIDPLGPVRDGVPPGALELYASGSGIEHQSGGQDPVAVLARADTDPAAAAIRDGLYVGVASAVRLLVLTLDVEVVALGGGLTRGGPHLVDGVRHVVERWRRESPLVDAVDLVGRLHVLDPDVPFAAIGAAMRGAGHG